MSHTHVAGSDPRRFHRAGSQLAEPAQRCQHAAAKPMEHRCEQGRERLCSQWLASVPSTLPTSSAHLSMCWMRPTWWSEHALADALEGWDVYYAAKSFLCATVARWVSDEGLGVDVCTGGELAVVQRAGLDPQRVGLHGNNKSVEELREALTIGVGRIIVDSFDEIARLGEIAEELRIRPRVMVRATTGVEAHTHEYIATAHEDQKFGFSIAGGIAGSALLACHRHPWLDLIGIHSTSARRSSTLRRSRSRHGVRSGCRPISQLRPAFNWPNWTSGRLRHRLHQRRHTIHTRCPGGGTSGDHRPRMLSTRHNRPAPLHRAGSRDQWSEHVRPLPRRHSQARRAGRRCEPSLRSSRRRDE